MSKQPKSVAVNVVDARKPREFFSLHGTYLVAPEAKTGDLTNDAACLLEASKAGVQALIDGIGDQASQMAANPKDAVALLFGVLYQLEMVGNLVAAIPVREAQS